MFRNTTVLPLTLLAVSFAHADFINGGFEDPHYSDDTSHLVSSSADLPGWNVNYSVLIENGYDGSGSGTTWHETSNGHQYLYINTSVGDEIASQSVALAAGLQSLSFLQADFASDFASPGGALFVSIVRDSDGLSIVDPTEFDVSAYSDFVSQTLAFAVPTAESYTFSFQGVSGHAANIDAVSVQAVPEPATLAALGIGAVGLLRRRHKA